MCKEVIAVAAEEDEVEGERGKQVLCLLLVPKTKQSLAIGLAGNTASAHV